MDVNLLIKGLLPGAIVGSVIYVLGAVVGPIMGAGWQDVIQGLSFFIGLIFALICILIFRRKQEAAGKKPS